MMEMVIQGVSTNKVSAITQELCGVSFSKSTVDAIYMWVREAGAIRTKAMLIAVGVNGEGHREIIGFRVGDGESYDAWHDFFGSLKTRGLSSVDLITSDDPKGLVKAAVEQFIGSIWQRCQTHFSRNRLDRVPNRHLCVTWRGSRLRRRHLTWDLTMSRRSSEFQSANANGSGRRTVWNG